jgi:NitT/TauT family transport system permease protein
MPGNNDRNLFERVTQRLGMGPVIAIVILIVWEMVTRSLQVSPSTLPSPTRLALEILREAPRLARYSWTTGVTAMEGLVFALLTALFVAVLSSVSPGTCRWVGPLMSFLQKAPLLALAPLLVVWLGYGKPPAVVFVFLVCVLNLTDHLQAGFSSLPQEVLDTLQSMRATRAQVLWKAQLPASLPYMTRSIKLCIPIALAGAAVAELVAADTGLGFLMLFASSRADSIQIFAALAVLSLMALFGCLVIFLVEQIWISWPAKEIQGQKRNPSRNLCDRLF